MTMFWHPEFGTLVGRAPPDGYIALPEKPSPEHVLANGEWILPPVPDPVEAARAVMRPIPRAQLFKALYRAGLITGAEAVAATRLGEIPAFVDVLISQLPIDDQVAARCDFGGFAQAHRTNPLVDLMGQAAGMTPQQIDAFFVTAATL